MATFQILTDSQVEQLAPAAKDAYIKELEAFNSNKPETSNATPETTDKPAKKLFTLLANETPYPRPESRNSVAKDATRAFLAKMSCTRVTPTKLHDNGVLCFASFNDAQNAARQMLNSNNVSTFRALTAIIEGDSTTAEFQVPPQNDGTKSKPEVRTKLLLDDGETDTKKQKSFFFNLQNIAAIPTPNQPFEFAAFDADIYYTMIITQGENAGKEVGMRTTKFLLQK